MSVITAPKPTEEELSAGYLSKDALAAKVEQVLAVFHEWDARPVPYGARKIVSEEVATELNELFELCDTNDVEEAARECVLGVDKLRKAAERWQKVMDAGATNRQLDGTREMWITLQELPGLLEPELPKRLESPESLSKLPSMTERQIAKMMGWKDRDGQPDVSKVREELAKPGTHFDVNSSVNPSYVERQKEIEEQWAARERDYTERVQQAEEAEPQPAPESLEELVLLTGVTVRQIQKIKPDATEHEIAAAAKRMGVTLPELVHYEAPPANAVEADKLAQRQAAEQAAQVDRIAEAKKLAAEQASEATLEEKVQALWQDGYNAQDIAKTLAADHQGLSPVRVGQMIAQMEAEAEANEEAQERAADADQSLVNAEILRLNAAGKTAKQIAEELGEPWLPNTVGIRLKKLIQG